ncbi:uncharacterized protein RJT21DRAFT_123057 [Scheffersomyces amazonensis]|uniref:uncharacterized protein n=1 Tax=Scheffersomyces amazonensis TaxID=1078765 RepID=UPI00315D6D8B
MSEYNNDYHVNINPTNRYDPNFKSLNNAFTNSTKLFQHPIPTNSKTIASKDLPSTVRPIVNPINTLDYYDYIFDTRPYNQYLQNHLVRSININIPTTLLKRKSLNLSSILDLINLPSECKTRLLNSTSTDVITILLYDHDSTNLALNSNLHQTLLKFHLFNPNFNLFYMGFQNAVIEPELLESEFTSDSISTSTSLSMGNSSSKSEIMSTTKISYSDEFVNTIKKKSDEYFKDDYTFNTYDLKVFPQWLEFLNSKSEDVISKLFNKFNKLEQSERLRIKSLISSNMNSPLHDSALCTPNTLCPNCDVINYKLPDGSIENGLKNRYKNIWPYEHSRVKINDQVDDYINANFINCNQILNTSRNNYIATQNPLNNTVDDFWKIINDFQVKIIISLDSMASHSYLDKLSSVEVIKSTSNYIVRKLNNEIYHFHILNWADFGVPTDFNNLLELIDLKNKLIKENNLDDSLVLVHCSAGCGRTGVFITIDTLINKYNQSRDLFFKDTLSEISSNPSKPTDLIYKIINFQRTQRISMVQNFQQYLLCYELILLYLKNIEQHSNV